MSARIRSEWQYQTISWTSEGGRGGCSAQVNQESKKQSRNGKTAQLRSAAAPCSHSDSVLHQHDFAPLDLSLSLTRASRSPHVNFCCYDRVFAPIACGASVSRSTLLFGVSWICRGGQLTAIQDAASRTPREECPAALGQAGRPGPDGGPLHGAIAEPHQPVGVL